MCMRITRLDILTEQLKYKHASNLKTHMHTHSNAGTRVLFFVRKFFEIFKILNFELDLSAETISETLPD